jgi:hypothetical protein
MPTSGEMRFDGGRSTPVKPTGGGRSKCASDREVAESTAQWRPCGTLERYWIPHRRQRDGAGPTAGTLHLGPVESRTARPKDFADAERLGEDSRAREPPAELRADVERDSGGRWVQGSITRAVSIPDRLGVTRKAPRVISPLSDLRTSAGGYRRRSPMLTSTASSLLAVGGCGHRTVRDARQHARISIPSIGASRARLKCRCRRPASISSTPMARPSRPPPRAVQRLAKYRAGRRSNATNHRGSRRDRSAFPSPQHLASWVGVCPARRTAGGAATGRRRAIVSCDACQWVAGMIRPKAASLSSCIDVWCRAWATRKPSGHAIAFVGYVGRSCPASPGARAGGDETARAPPCVRNDPGTPDHGYRVEPIPSLSRTSRDRRFSTLDRAARRVHS